MDLEDWRMHPKIRANTPLFLSFLAFWRKHGISEIKSLYEGNLSDFVYFRRKFIRSKGNY